MTYSSTWTCRDSLKVRRSPTAPGEQDESSPTLRDSVVCEIEHFPCNLVAAAPQTSQQRRKAMVLL